MNAREAGKLLATCATFDNRTPSTAASLAWATVLGDLAYADCDRAVTDHYAATGAWIMPADIRRRVKAMRADRIERASLGLGFSDEAASDPARYIAELRAGIAAAAGGPPQRRAIGGSR